MKKVLRILVVLVVATLLTGSRSAQPPVVVYVYDALCGWCYGFSPVMAKAEKEFGDKALFRVVSGGLRIDEGVGTINDVAPFIKTAYGDVEKATGVKFGEASVNKLIKTGTMRLNSLPAAIAMSIVKERNVALSLAYTRQLHKMIYVDGHDPETISQYAVYAAAIGIDTVGFTQAMRSHNYEQLARADFAYAANMGVTGFPAVFIAREGRLTRLTNGYVGWAELEKQLKAGLQ